MPQLRVASYLLVYVHRVNYDESFLLSRYITKFSEFVFLA